MRGPRLRAGIGCYTDNKKRRISLMMERYSARASGRLIHWVDDCRSSIGHAKIAGPQEYFLVDGAPARQALQRADRQRGRETRDHYRRETLARHRVHPAGGRGANHLPQSQGHAYACDHGRARHDSGLPAAGTPASVTIFAAKRLLLAGSGRSNSRRSSRYRLGVASADFKRLAESYLGRWDLVQLRCANFMSCTLEERLALILLELCENFGIPDPKGNAADAADAAQGSS